MMQEFEYNQSIPRHSELLAGTNLIASRVVAPSALPARTYPIEEITTECFA